MKGKDRHVRVVVCVFLYRSDIGYMYIPTGTHPFTCNRETKVNSRHNLATRSTKEKHNALVNLRHSQPTYFITWLVLFPVCSEGVCSVLQFGLPIRFKGLIKPPPSDPLRVRETFDQSAVGLTDCRGLNHSWVPECLASQRSWRNN